MNEKIEKARIGQGIWWELSWAFTGFGIGYLVAIIFGGL